MILTSKGLRPFFAALLAFLFLALGLSLPLPAQATFITITSGEIFADGGPPVCFFPNCTSPGQQWTAGGDLFGEGFKLSFGTLLSFPDLTLLGLQPGKSIEPSDTWNNLTKDGSFTVNGVFYVFGPPCSSVGCPGVNLGFAGISVSDPMVVPPSGTDPVTLTTPFTLSGSVGDFHGNPQLASFSGGGIAAADFVPSTTPGLWDLTEVTYTLQRVPEPSVAFLLVPGLMVLAIGRRRRSR